MANLKRGSRGAEVTALQRRLIEIGVLQGKADGIFGPATERAVKNFQASVELDVDGVVGPNTRAALDGASPGSGTGPPAAPVGPSLIGTPIPMSEVRTFFGRGDSVLITDLDSGLQYEGRARSVDGKHADVCPATSSDTEMLRAIYDLSTEDEFVPWCGKEAPNRIRRLWKRRAIVCEFQAHEGRVAASQHGCPHGGGFDGNDYPGHFCIHFRGSMTHGTKTGVPRVDEKHQAMVDKAAGLT